MAQTKKRRRRKHRGTQGGRIDRRPRGRARSRAEAKARARSRGKNRGGPRTPQPPSWNSALKKGAIASALFFALLAIMGQALPASLAIAVLMMGFYVPMSFLMDRFLYQRYLRKEAAKRSEREAQRTGGGPAKG